MDFFNKRMLVTVLSKMSIIAARLIPTSIWTSIADCWGPVEVDTCARELNQSTSFVNQTKEKKSIFFSFFVIFVTSANR